MTRTDLYNLINKRVRWKLNIWIILIIIVNPRDIVWKFNEKIFPFLIKNFSFYISLSNLWFNKFEKIKFSPFFTSRVKIKCQERTSAWCWRIRNTYEKKWKTSWKSQISYFYLFACRLIFCVIFIFISLSLFFLICTHPSLMCKKSEKLQYAAI